MTEPSGYVLETLWGDVEFVLSRGARGGEPSPLLAVAPTSAQPSPGSLTRLEHAYRLRDELDPAYAARPLDWSGNGHRASGCRRAYRAPRAR